MSKQRQSRTQLELHLREQVEFLETSGELFDRGRLAEAKRLATTIRILVHDSKSSTSLLEQLGLKTHLRWVDTSRPAAEAYGRPRASVTLHAGLAIIQIGFDGRRTGFAAPLWEDLHEHRRDRPRSSFNDWWSSTLLKDNESHEFSRRDFVLGLAHMDGGAHVDPQLGEAYAALSRGNSHGWGFWDEGGHLLFAESPVLATVRQIAFEVEATLRLEVPELLRTSRISSPSEVRPRIARQGAGLLVDELVLVPVDPSDRKRSASGQR